MPVLRSILERAAAGMALLLLSPVLLAAAICVAIETGRPVLFRQTRIGKAGRPFRLLKFRSMRMGTPGAPITSGGDRRVTRVGRVLRKYKLDEMPQFWNILAGHMQLIGPRPEVPDFVRASEPDWADVLREKPGLTDLSSLVFRNEEEILAQSADPVRAYREQVLPRKLRLSRSYGRRRTLRSDCRILLLTARYSLFPAGFDADRILTTFLEHS